MPVIDENGRLFGLVNVIDALAVLLVLAVIVAGIALVDPFGPPAQPAVRYATVDLGTQPNYVASAIRVGDNVSAETGPGNLTITDAYIAPAGTDRGAVIVRARIHGQVSGQYIPGPVSFEYGDTVLRPGAVIALDTTEYTVRGNITSLDRADSGLPKTETHVVLQADVPGDVAFRINEGDKYQLDESGGASIASIAVFPNGSSDMHRIFVGLSLDTIARTEGTFFGPVRVTVASSIPFVTDDYTFTGRVTRIGTTQLDTRELPVVIETTIPQTTANALTVDDAFRVNGTTIGTVESVTLYPTGNPATRHAVIGLSLQTIRDGSNNRFGDRLVKLGTTIPFTTDAYTLTGEIIRIGANEPPGDPAETTVTLKLHNVAPEVAASIHPGMTETQNGVTRARIEDKVTEPAVVVLESDDGNIFRRDHPVNKDVTLTVTLQTRETQTGLTFHGRVLQEDSEIILDLGQITIRGTVTTIR